MLSKNEIVQVKKEALIKSIKRKENLAALNDYVAFVTTKSFGLISMITGIIEMANPDFHPVKLLPAESILAIGLGLLTGSGIIKILSKVAEALKS
jgi:hypothetical protein